MNIGEAVAAQTLLRYLLDPHPHVDEAHDDDDALEAALLLAEKSDKTLSAGLTRDDVTRLWPAMLERQ